MEKREQIWNEYKGAKPIYIAHAWLHYTRYFEANAILNTLKEFGEIINKLRVVDYGCGVGDYGITFIREGAFVKFFDKREELDFVEYRLELESKNTPDLRLIKEVNEETPFIDGDGDIVIFGEVLEHLSDAFEVLNIYVESKTKYIFTSSYPYRSSDPDDPYWHRRGHNPELCFLQPKCRKILEDNYTFTKYEGEMRLWKRK